MIKLISAFYGPKNVTAIISDKIQNNESFIVSNKQFNGDPEPNIPKYLNIKYEKDGVLIEESFKEDVMCILNTGTSIQLRFNLIDDSFVGWESAVGGVKPIFVKWQRVNYNVPTFYCNGMIRDVITQKTTKENSYAMLFESRAIINHEEAEKYVPNFEKFFTHNSNFLKKYDNCYWMPGGGIWVGGSVGKGEIKITKKTKICSLVSSNKKMCKLHNYRLEIVDNLKNSIVDIFGLNNWKPIYESLENYMFSIVVENFQDELYFTEKILNCFATGTIPIYLGAKNISEKFNIDGILCFNTIEELNEIIPLLSEELYYSKMDAIKENFERCQQYRVIEDYIFNNYFRNLPNFDQYLIPKE